MMNSFDNVFGKHRCGVPAAEACYAMRPLSLGNQMQTDSIPALTRGLVDTEPLVRGASAWALGKIGGAAATLALEMQLKREHDPVVTSELDDALSILKR